MLGYIKQDGYSLIPLSIYFNGPKVKVEVGLCKGKKQHDKRDTMAKKDADRQMDRVMKAKNKES